jgi:PAS domain S-box-containing protein
MLKIQELEALVPAYLRNSDLLYVCVLDFEGQVCLAGKIFYQLFEPNGADLLEKNFLDCIHPQVKFDLKEFLWKVIEMPLHHSLIDLVHFNNLTVHWEFSMLRDIEGDFAGILAMGHKISKNHDELSLIPSFQGKSDNSGEFLIRLNSDWEVVHINQHAESFFNKKEEGILGKTIWQLYPDLNFYQYALEFKKAKESKIPRVFEEYNSLSGKFYNIHVHPSPNGFDLIIKDTTELKKLTKSLRKTKVSLETILEHSEENIFFVGKDLRIFAFNSKAACLVKAQFGRTIKKGDKFLNFLLDGMDEVVLGNLERILAGDSLNTEKEIIDTHSGDAIWFNLKFYPLKDRNEKQHGFVFACKEIHEEKRSTQNLQKQNKLMREVLYNQSSMLRSPLSSIMGLLELIDNAQLDKENQKYFSYLKPLAVELDRIIRDNSKQISDLD